MTAPKEVNFIALREEWFKENPTAYEVVTGKTEEYRTMCLSEILENHNTEVQALKADLEAKEQRIAELEAENKEIKILNDRAHSSAPFKRIEQLETRIKGMVLSLQKHGQNIDVKFHIDWLNEALSQKGG